METFDVEQLRQAVQAAPERVDTRLALLRALMTAADWEEAESVGEVLLRRASPPPETHTLMGVIYGKRERRDDAIHQCRQALEHQPEDLLSQYNLAVLLAQQDDFEAAVSQLQNVTTRHHTWPAAHYNLGVVLMRLARYTEAIEAFENAIDHCDDYPEAHFNSGNAHAMLGLPDDGGLDYYEVDCAINAYKRAIQQRPGYTSALFNLGMLYGRMTSSEGVRVWQQYLEAAQHLPDEEIWCLRAREYQRNLQDRLR
jgi:tetratricopeptide (TPR) repeat protein